MPDSRILNCEKIFHSWLFTSAQEIERRVVVESAYEYISEKYTTSQYIVYTFCCGYPSRRGASDTIYWHLVLSC